MYETVHYYFMGMNVKVGYLTYNASNSVYAHMNIHFLCQNLTLSSDCKSLSYHDICFNL